MMKKKKIPIWNIYKMYVLNNIFPILMTVIKVAKNQIFLDNSTSYLTNLTLIFFAFSFALTKTKAEQIIGQQ